MAPHRPWSAPPPPLPPGFPRPHRPHNPTGPSARPHRQPHICRSASGAELHCCQAERCLDSHPSHGKAPRAGVARSPSHAPSHIAKASGSSAVWGDDASVVGGGGLSGDVEIALALARSVGVVSAEGRRGRRGSATYTFRLDGVPCHLGSRVPGQLGSSSCVSADLRQAPRLPTCTLLPSGLCTWHCADRHPSFAVDLCKVLQLVAALRLGHLGAVFGCGSLRLRARRGMHFAIGFALGGMSERLHLCIPGLCHEPKGGHLTWPSVWGIAGIHDAIVKVTCRSASHSHATNA